MVNTSVSEGKLGLIAFMRLIISHTKQRGNFVIYHVRRLSKMILASQSDV